MAESSLPPDALALLKWIAAKKRRSASAGDLASSKFASDPASLDRAASALIDSGLVQVQGGAKTGPHPRAKGSYKATDAGLATIRPDRPDVSDEIVDARDAYILLKVFRAGEEGLTRSKIVDAMKSQGAMSNLDFEDKSAVGAQVDYHLHELTRKGRLEARPAGASVRYVLRSPGGVEGLLDARHHERMNLQLNGLVLNQLLAAAREARRVEPASAPPPEPVRRTAPPHGGLDAEEVTRCIETLAGDRYAGKDLVPIHAVRALVAARRGAEAASHPVFDPLVKSMRGEGLIRLIAISDNRDATQGELDDSIPGVNETLFYVVVR